jgi:hypothetical protein
MDNMNDYMLLPSVLGSVNVNNLEPVSSEAYFN